MLQDATFYVAKCALLRNVTEITSRCATFFVAGRNANVAGRNARAKNVAGCNAYKEVLEKEKRNKRTKKDSHASRSVS